MWILPRQLKRFGFCSELRRRKRQQLKAEFVVMKRFVS